MWRGPQTATAKPEADSAELSPDRPGLSGAVPGSDAATAPARPAPPELSAQRRLTVAWQLLSAYRPAALWQARRCGRYFCIVCAIMSSDAAVSLTHRQALMTGMVGSRHPCAQQGWARIDATEAGACPS